MHGVGHGLGGIAGFDAREIETEAPDTLEATKSLTLAWLRTVLGVEARAWQLPATHLPDLHQHWRTSSRATSLTQIEAEKEGGLPKEFRSA